MSRARRRPSSPPRCGSCRAPIRWLRLRGRWRSFEPTPVDQFDPTIGAPVYPVEERTAWPVGALVEEFMGRRGVGEDEARAEVDDLDWYRVHSCRPSDPDGADDQDDDVDERVVPR